MMRPIGYKGDKKNKQTKTVQQRSIKIICFGNFFFPLVIIVHIAEYIDQPGKGCQSCSWSAEVMANNFFPVPIRA